VILKRLPLRFQKNSLFMKLLTGFLGLIVLLLSFNFLSFAFFSDNIQKEIIRNNKINLANTVDRYENHLSIIKNTAILLYFNPKVILLNELANSSQFDPVNQIADEIKALTNNELLYVDNVILQFRKNGYIVDKSGSSDTEWFFSKHYFSADYDVPFWLDQLRMTYEISVLPQSDFTKFSTGATKNLIPIIVKNKLFDNQIQIVVMLQANKILKTFNNSGESRFYMINASGRQVFGSSAEPLDEGILNALTPGNENYVKRGNEYIFYKTGTVTGLTYLSIIPNNKIASEMSRLNMVLLSMFVLATAISVLISIVLSVKFNSPIKKIMNAIQKQGPGSPLQSNIDEYNFIYDNVKHFMQTNQDFRADLNKNNAMLRNFRYMRKAKNIYNESSESFEETTPFYLIGFHLTMTEQFGGMVTAQQDRAMYYIKEFIHTTLSDSFKDPVTIQIEKDLILSILFMEQASADIVPALQQLKRVFDLDKEICYLTIACQPVLRSPETFTVAYEETLEMIHRRKLVSETQIITEMPLEPLVVGFSAGQEKEFLVHLEAGKGTRVIELVKRQLTQMEKIGATAHQYSEFTKEVIAKTIKTMITMNLDISTVFDRNSPYQKIKECICLQDYLDLCELFLSGAAAMIADKKNGSDPGKHAMMEYVNRNFHRDISLEMVAEELELSVHYISKYFKDKTGMNFLDYVSELRIVKAKELLLHSKIKIQDIAEQVGYINTNSFIRMFRKATGISPGEFRRQRIIGDGD